MTSHSVMINLIMRNHQRHMIHELYFLLTTKIQPTLDPTGKVDAVELIRCSTSHHLDDCFWLISSRVFFFFLDSEADNNQLNFFLICFSTACAPNFLYLFVFNFNFYCRTKTPNLTEFRVLSSTYFRSKLRQTSLQCYLRKTDLTPSFLRRRIGLSRPDLPLSSPNVVFI